MTPEMTILALIAFFFLFGLFFVSSFLHVARRLRKEVSQQYLQASSQAVYFQIHKFLFSDRIDTLLFCLTCVQYTLSVLYLGFLYSTFFGASAPLDYLFSAAWQH